MQSRYMFNIIKIACLQIITHKLKSKKHVWDYARSSERWQYLLHSFLMNFQIPFPLKTFLLFAAK